MPATRNLSKRLGGADFRKAVAALAAMRQLDPGERRAHIPAVHAQDEQRAFQLRVAQLIAHGDVRAVVDAWQDLPSAQWREQLLYVIEQTFPDWADDATIDLFIAGLEDPEPGVARRAVIALRNVLETRSAKERKQAEKTKVGKRYLEAYDQAAAAITPVRRARIARAVTAALRRSADNPRLLTWPDRFIDLLGMTATRDDEEALAVLEGLRALAGEPRRTEISTLDPDNLPWETALVAERKGIPRGTPFTRVASIPTGLLDLKNLEDAIARIRARDGSGEQPADADR